MASLQDQLLKAGIVDKKKAKQVKQEKHKEIKQQSKGKPVVDETRELARMAMTEKAARDREINRQRQAEAEKKAVAAQIVQLVAMNRIPREKGDGAYQFPDGKIIKKLYVSDRQHGQLVSGVIAVARAGDSYELIPAAVAEKIKQRDESAIVVHNIRSAAVLAEEDPYAQYQIPDDLMW